MNHCEQQIKFAQGYISLLEKKITWQEYAWSNGFCAGITICLIITMIYLFYFNKKQNEIREKAKV